MIKNKLRKLIVTTGLVAAMTCSLCACGKKDEETTAATTATTTEAVTTEATTTEAATTEAGGQDVASDNTTASQDDNNDANADDTFSGMYVESVAQRGCIYISKAGDGTYEVEITWPDSAYKSNYWAMHGTFDANGVLTYDDCVKTVTVFDEDGNETEENGKQSPYIDYENGKGTITCKNGVVSWVDEEEHIGDGAEFLRDFNNSTGTIGR